MPDYPTPPRFTDKLSDHERRIGLLEIKVASKLAQGTSAAPLMYDSNVVGNSGMEAGAAGWRALYSTGALGVLSVETASPLNELSSLRVDEAASQYSRVYWRGAGAPVLNSDVFATAPGEVWRLSALMRASADVPSGQLVASCGTTAADVFGNLSAQTWVVAASVPLAAGVVTALSGTITVPATRNFIGFMAVGSTATIPAAPWAWWLDDAVLQRRL